MTAGNHKMRFIDVYSSSVLILLFILIQCATSQVNEQDLLYEYIKETTSRVCYRKVSQSYKAGPIYEYETDYYEYSCGWLGWSVCKRSEKVLKKIRGTYTAYKHVTQTLCCSGYEGDPQSSSGCIASCRLDETCLNGYCLLDQGCVCHRHWTGSTCNKEANLRQWCDSISDYSLDSSNALSRVQSNHEVFCSDSFTSGFPYDPDATQSLDSKRTEDINRCPQQYRTPLFAFWREHATSLRFCCMSHLLAHHFSNFLNAFDVQAELQAYLEAFDPTIAVQLRQEMSNCPSTYSAETFNSFCSLKIVIEIIDILQKADHSQNQWTRQQRQDFKIAVQSHITILVELYPNELSTLNINIDDALISGTRKLLALMRDPGTSFSTLELFVKLLPHKGMYRSADSGTCEQLNHVCIFLNTAEEAHIYIDILKEDTNPPSYDGKRRLVLNTDLDYAGVLEQSRLDQILATIDNNQLTLLELGNQIKNSITNSFSTFSQYFSNMKSFDQQIAEADIGYITGRLNHYTTTVAKSAGRFKVDMSVLLKKTILAAGFNIAEHSIRMAMEVASAYNPLKALTGGTSPADIMDALADLSNAISVFVEAKSIRDSLLELKDILEELSKGFAANAEHLESVKVLVDRTSYSDEEFEKSKIAFIKMYSDYSPSVKITDIEKMGAVIDTMIDKTCGLLLESLDTTAAAVIKIEINNAGYCRDLPGLATEMIVTYTEIYDYQFDLIDSLADYVRSVVGLNTVEEINSELSEASGNIDSYSSTTYELMGGLIYISYASYNMHIIHLECNRLEYLSGGRRPSACNGKDTNVGTLINVNKPVCYGTRDVFHVPTQPYLDSSDSKSFINITELFTKDHTIRFKVPSADWLVRNRWIDSDEQNNAFFVKDLQVFLPLKPQSPKRIKSTAKTTVYNELTPGSTEYVLIPNPLIEFKYELGPPARIPCDPLDFKINPYTTCDTTSVSKYCDKSLPVTHHLYPSIYSEWSITMSGWDDGDSEVVAPNPANNDFTVMMGVQYCRVPLQSTAASFAENNMNKRHIGYHDSAAVHLQQGAHCCPSGEYRPDRFSTCYPCPEGSESGLAGYYCETTNTDE